MTTDITSYYETLETLSSSRLPAAKPAHTYLSMICEMAWKRINNKTAPFRPAHIAQIEHVCTNTIMQALAHCLRGSLRRQIDLSAIDADHLYPAAARVKIWEENLFWQLGGDITQWLLMLKFLILLASKIYKCFAMLHSWEFTTCC